MNKYRSEPKVVRTKEYSGMSKPERMINLMAALANTDTGKYPHAFFMVVDDNNQPIVIAMRPKIPEAVMILPKGMMILDLAGNSDSIVPNINYLRNEAGDCDRSVELDGKMVLGVARMTPVEALSPDIRSTEFLRAQKIINECEAYWKNPQVEETVLSTEELVDLF